MNRFLNNNIESGVGLVVIQLYCIVIARNCYITPMYIALHNSCTCTVLTYHIKFLCRVKVLTHREWTKFNRCLFQEMFHIYEKEMTFEVDAESLRTIRVALNEHGSWAWFVWESTEIPCNESDAQPLPVKARPNVKQRAPGKDAIYQKWRTKYNNDTMQGKEEERDKKKDGEKPSTGRQNVQGVPLDEHGTLRGIVGGWHSIPEVLFLEYRTMTSAMKVSLTTLVGQVTELVRLWEVHYAVFHDISRDTLVQFYMEDKLASMNKFKYFEGYANKICQLEDGSKDRLVGLLYDLGKAFPRIFRNEKFNPVNADEYNDKPLISVLNTMGMFFKECKNIVVVLPEGLSTEPEAAKREIMDCLTEAGHCQCIIDYEKIYNRRKGQQRYGVGSNGVPIVKDLTEEEAVFVFATIRDVLGYDPDRSKQPEATRIDLLVEFLRRSCLGICDDTDRSGLRQIKE